jgi:glycosyltransferase involved in cell wall biosynthesis
MPKVIHLLPYDGIGGAEAAARSMADSPLAGLDFQVRFLFPSVSSRRHRAATFNPFAALPAIRGVVREKPDLLLVSLWRSCLAGLLVKMLCPRMRMVVMIHNSVDAHFADWLATRLAMTVASEVWADSEASMRLRFGRPPRAPVTVIPFLTKHLEPVAETGVRARPEPRFVFWGRLAAQKNLRKALQLFQQVHRSRPDACYTVIGPDSGELDGLRDWCADKGLGDAVVFAGPMLFEAIRLAAEKHSFYLQTSDYEGMAMSVVEAMQLGLVPVVTPVGEIARYCQDGVNAVLVDDIHGTAGRLLRLFDDADEFIALRARASSTWVGQPLYRDAVAAACRRLTASH